MQRQTHMKSEVYNKVPQWFKDSKEGQYSVMVGDDIDSLASATLLKQYMDWDINWFYDFHQIYVIDDSKTIKNRVGVDMALEMNERTIDNHVTMLHKDDTPNENSVNMNTLYGVNRDNYTDKYAMSTLLTAWSLLGIPLPSTDEGKKILLSIDSSFKGNYNDRFKKTHNEWLRKLGFEELIDFLDNETSFEELDVVIRNRYNLSGKIKIDEKGQLQTNIDIEGIGEYLEIDLELPEDVFNFKYKLNRRNSRMDRDKKYNKQEKTYSFALTYKDVASFTTL